MIYEKITFNIFTNCTVNSPEIFPMNLLFETLIDVFNLEINRMKINIFIDPSPKSSKFKQFNSNIKDYFLNSFNIYKTNGLADGFAKALEVSTTPFIFNMEHDFLFYKKNIINSLEEIINTIEKCEEIVLIRFHHSNLKVDNYDKYLNEKIINGVKLYETPNVANYIQIINVNKYKEKYLPLIDKNAKKSYGIEANLTGQKGCYVYAGKNNLRNVQHINGRKKGGFDNNYGEICSSCGLSKADIFNCSKEGKH